MAISIEEAYEKIKKNEWEVIDHDFPSYFYLPDNELSNKWKEYRDEAKEFLSPLIDNEIAIDNYLFGASDGILSNLIKSSGKSHSYIHNKTHQWFRGGGMLNALLPRFKNCGTNHTLPAKPIINSDGSVCIAAKPGKPTKYGLPFRQVTQQDLKKIEAFSKKIPQGTKVNLMDLYEKFIRESMSFSFSPNSSANQEDVHSEIITYPRDHLISPRSFQYFLNSFVHDLDWILKRVGQITYDRDHKGKPGVARTGLRNAGQRFEIDATIADVYVRYPYTNQELLSCGRPVIYFVIDTYSAMVVGFHIAFDGPNWVGASQAFFNAFENKVEFCRRWGVEINENDWPCDFICSEIVWDRGGENSDNHLSSVLKGKIGVKTMKLAAYHRGDCKGTVEKTFDIVLSETITFDPGRVEKYPSKELQHASRTPFLEFDDLVKKIIKIIIHKNNFSRKLEAHDFHMESIGVGYTPRDIWNHFMSNIIHKPKISKDKIRFALMPEAEATVTEKGIHFRGLHFSNSQIEKMLWLDKAKNLGRSKIKIRYSDLTTNHIWHYDEEKNELMMLNLLERSEAYKNQIWANVLHRLEIRKHELANRDAARFNAQMMLDMDLSEIDEEIKKRNRRLKKSEAKNSEPGTKKRKDTVVAVHRNEQASQTVSDMQTGTNISEPAANHTDELSDQDLTDPTFIY